MPLPKRTLNVLANPWIHLDHQGRPAGATPMDVGPGQKVFVGAELDTEQTQIVDRPGRGELRSHVQDTVWKFSDEPAVVPATPYYIRRLRSGELLAADKQSARIAGVEF